MIAGVIVLLSIVFAGIYTLAYLLRPEIRKQIEKPKFVFQTQIEQYNSQNEQTSVSTTREEDE